MPPSRRPVDIIKRARIDNDKRDIGRRSAGPSAQDPFGLDPPFADRPKACRIGQDCRIAAEIQMNFDHVAGCALDRRDNRCLAARQTIEKA